MIRLLRQRDFALLWGGGLVSMTGNWLLHAALPLSVYQITGSTLALGAMLIVSTVPRLLLGSLAGVLVDRWDRQRILVVSNALFAVGLLPLLAVDGPERIWIVYAVGAWQSVVSLFSLPAEHALLPTLVGESDLMPANALNSLNNEIARLIGPAIGAVVFAAFGLGTVAVLDAVTFAVAAAATALLRVPPRVREAAQVAAAEVAHVATGVYAEWLDGLRTIFRQRALLALFAFITATSFSEAVMGTLFVPFVLDVLRGTSADYGFILASQAVGGLAGALIVGRFGGRPGPRRLLAYGAMWLGFVDFLIFTHPLLVPGVVFAMVLFVVVGLSAPAMRIAYSTLTQQLVPDSHRGRVFGAFGAAGAFAVMCGAATGGALAEHLPVMAVINIQAATYFVGGVALVFVLRGATLMRTAAAAPARA